MHRGSYGTAGLLGQPLKRLGMLKQNFFVYGESFYDYDLSDINVTSMRRGKRVRAQMH